uniref:Uncharacterized protein n=1 Tax=viral metagenome TaxID=1070528 RepID=A0A6C0KXN4_9ZZZZ
MLTFFSIKKNFLEHYAQKRKIAKKSSGNPLAFRIWTFFLSIFEKSNHFWE